MNLSNLAPSALYLVMQLALLALFVVGAVRSRGVARLLLLVWVVVSSVATVMQFFVPVFMQRFDMKASEVGLLLGVFGTFSSVLLGVAILIGRPGYRGDSTPPLAYSYNLGQPGGPSQMPPAGPTPPYGQPGSPNPYGQGPDGPTHQP